MDYTIRINCLFCNNKLSTSNLYFENDRKIPIACYSQDECNNDIIIPYNVYTCDNCKVSQTKYLGNLEIIYKFNHADSTGKIMQNMHIKIRRFQ